MSTYIFDLDGTLLEFHTNKWLIGAKDMLNRIISEGNKILFITMRSDIDKDTIWSIENTKTLLNELDFEYQICFGIDSPRVIYDDVDAKAFLHERNSKW